MKWIKNFNLTQGLSLVSIPIVGYVSAFFYLSGKYSFYNLPIFFVEINTELAIFASLVVIIVILSISLLIYIITRPTKKGVSQGFKPATKQSLIWTFIFFLVTYIVLVYFILNNLILSLLLKIILILVTYCFLFLYIFITPMIKYRGAKNYLEKYNLFSEDLYKAEIKKKDNKMGIKIDFSNFISFLRIKYVLIPLFTFLWISVAYLYGYSEGASQTKYAILNYNNENYIIVGKFNDNLLLVGLDLKNKVTKNKVMLKPIDEIIIVDQKDVGKLNIVK